MAANWTEGYVSDIPYTTNFFGELAPSNIQVALLERGVHAGVALGKPFTWCELGCGRGLTTNLLAGANPQGQFYATDFMPGHISEARALAEEAGLTNAHFFDDDFASFCERPELPQFDYIVIHGVYSWVPDETRKAIVRFFEKKLKVGGVVIVSYNTDVGWDAVHPFQRLVRDVVPDHGLGSVERINRGMALLDRLEAVGARGYVNNPIAMQRIRQMRENDQTYVSHELLNGAWNPMSFGQVAGELDAAKLTFVGSSRVMNNLDFMNFSPEQIAVLNEAGGVVLQETMRDMILARAFRSDMFVRGPVAMTIQEQIAGWRALKIYGRKMQVQAPEKVQTLAGEATLQLDIYQPIIDALRAGPTTVGALEQKFAGKMAMNQLAQAIVVLIAIQFAWPVVHADPRKVKSAEGLNKALMTRARMSGALSFLAAPANGSAVHADRIMQLLLASAKAGEKDLTKAVMATLEAHGERAAGPDGLPLPQEEAEAQFRPKAEAFEKTQRAELELHGAG